MDIDLAIAFGCSAAAATTLAYAAFRSVANATTGGGAGTSASVRTLLSLPASFVISRRDSDPELAKTLDRYEKLVVQSGGTFLGGATAAEVFAARFVFPLIAVAAVLLIGTVLRLSGGIVLLGATFFGVLMYAYPETSLKAAAGERSRRFTRDLPGALDVMRLVAQSGGDLGGSIRAVIEVSPPGPVRDELARALAEVAIGASLAKALTNIAERVGTNEANAVFSTLAQSLEMGASVAENLKSAAQLIRHAARVRAQTQAQKAVVTMTFPLLLLILPGIFIVLFAPLVIQFVNR